MEINIYQILFQIFNFGVVMYLLNRVLYKPVLKMLDERAKKINEGMSLAEKNMKAAEDAEKTKKAEIAKARKEASSIIATAEKEAKAKADQIISEAKAKAEAAAMVAAASKEIESGKAKAEKAIAQLAIKQAQSALGGSLTSKEIDSITSSMLKAK
jgi:F-type H+-transporting ATPase subunit b